MLTSWRGSAVFRPHAYRYPFLHPGMLAALSDEEKGAQLLAVLTARPPAAVIRDEHTRKLGEEVQAFIDRHFVPSGVGDVWLRGSR